MGYERVCDMRGCVMRGWEMKVDTDLFCMLVLT